MIDSGHKVNKYYEMTGEKQEPGAKKKSPEREMSFGLTGVYFPDYPR